MIDMTNALLNEFVGGKFPHSMGNPVRCNHFREYYIANSVEDIEEFIKENNELNCYCSIYSYTEYTQQKRNKFSAILDCIVFDFDDSDNLDHAIEDAKKLVSWANRHGSKPRIHFTGGRGVHVFIDLVPINIKHPQETIRKFCIELNKNAQLDTLDLSIAGDLERIIRIPNTIHKKTGLYCIPINPILFPFLSAKDLIKMAEHKSNYIPIRYPTDGEIYDELLKMDKEVKVEIEEFKKKLEEKERARKNSLFPEIKKGTACLAYIDCMENGIAAGYRNFALAGIAQKCKKDGYTFDKTFRMMLEFGKKCTPVLTESEIKSVLGYQFRMDYSICTFFSKFSDNCNVCPNRKF